MQGNGPGWPTQKDVPEGRQVTGCPPLATGKPPNIIMYSTVQYLPHQLHRSRTTLEPPSMPIPNFLPVTNPDTLPGGSRTQRIEIHHYFRHQIKDIMPPAIVRRKHGTLDQVEGDFPLDPSVVQCNPSIPSLVHAVTFTRTTENK